MLVRAYQKGRAFYLGRELTLARAPRHTPDSVLLNPSPRAMAIVAAVAVALAGLLPFAHMHAEEHDPVVHRHVIGGESNEHDAGAADHDASVDHDDHSDAQILTLSYEVARPFAGIASAVAASWALADSAAAAAKPVSRRTLLPTHDPPLRFASSPAPPAVV